MEEAEPAVPEPGKELNSEKLSLGKMSKEAVEDISDDEI
jgi:hypothetical protein